MDILKEKLTAGHIQTGKLEIHQQETGGWSRNMGMAAM